MAPSTSITTAVESGAPAAAKTTVGTVGPLGWWPDAALDETFEAIVADWALVERCVVSPTGRNAVLEPRGPLAELIAGGVHLVVVGGPDQAAPGGASEPWVEPQGRILSWRPAARHVEPVAAGLRFDLGEWLARGGVTGRLLLVACSSCRPDGGSMALQSSRVEPWLARAAVVCLQAASHDQVTGVLHPGGSCAGMDPVLTSQVERRRRCRVPQVDVDPRWVVPLDGHGPAEAVAESLGALANGRVGCRGSREETAPWRAPSFLGAGVYTPEDVLLDGPIWTGVDYAGGDGDGRVLDLRTGVLARRPSAGTGLRSFRFVSAADPSALGLRAEAGGPGPVADPVLRAPRQPVGWKRIERDGVVLARTGQAAERRIVVAARDRIDRFDGGWTLDRLATWTTDVGEQVFERARGDLRVLEDAGFDVLLGRHRRAWAQRWAGAGVSIKGCPDDELAARFAVFHLLSSAADDGEAAVGARGLSGPAYGGHVFWDADVFVLPALAAIRPRAARAMLEYRIRRLPRALAIARAEGRSGARYPWESAADGRDVTPRSVRGGNGRLIPIATGGHEVHIVADVAWSALRYGVWSGDHEFVTSGPGRDLVVDTARYWVSRVRTDRDGRAHLFGVMGPDEYHEVVDDNAFTNGLAAWNMRAAADLLDEGQSDDAAAMRSLADSLVDGWHSESGIYEQFAGYFGLEPLLVADVAPPPVAIDVLLGAERVAESQLIKQPDVLMLHHMLPDCVEAGSLAPCLDYYGPRTAHGSSLSPAVHASLLARAGRPDEALQMFRLAARLDLDDLTGTTAQGLHLATMGGLWQALAYGFLGLTVQNGTLCIDPSLPALWTALGMRFSFRGQVIEVTADPERVIVTCQAPLVVHLAGGPPVGCRPPSTSIRRPTRGPEPAARGVSP